MSVYTIRHRLGNKRPYIVYRDGYLVSRFVGREAAESCVRSAQSVDAHRAETAQVVAMGKCPVCGGGLRRNLSLAGWWQCEQLGAVGFRKDPNLPSCSWQGFTE